MTLDGHPGIYWNTSSLLPTASNSDPVFRKSRMTGAQRVSVKARSRHVAVVLYIYGAPQSSS